MMHGLVEAASELRPFRIGGRKRQLDRYRAESGVALEAGAKVENGDSFALERRRRRVAEPVAFAGAQQESR